MYTTAQILGIITVLFFVLASANGLKKVIKISPVRWLAKHHRFFGGAAILTALIHLIVNLSNGMMNALGALTFLSLFTTALMGLAFKEKKSKSFYVAHRLMGPITLVLIIIHILTN
jgi:hypothetical protein